MFELASSCFIMVFFLVQLMDNSVWPHVWFVGRQDSGVLTKIACLFLTCIHSTQCETSWDSCEIKFGRWKLLLWRFRWPITVNQEGLCFLYVEFVFLCNQSSYFLTYSCACRFVSFLSNDLREKTALFNFRGHLNWLSMKWDNRGITVLISRD